MSSGCYFCGYSPCICGRRDYGEETREQYLERIYGNDCPSCGGPVGNCACHYPYRVTNEPSET
jgi:hypothetical protein